MRYRFPQPSVPRGALPDRAPVAGPLAGARSAHEHSPSLIQSKKLMRRETPGAATSGPSQRVLPAGDPAAELPAGAKAAREQSHRP